MRLEDGCLFRLIFLPQTVDGCEQRLGNGDKRRLRLVLLLGYGIGFVRREIAVEVLPREQHLTDGNAGDNTLSSDCFCHVLSPL